jgi:hypothetical protein
VKPEVLYKYADISHNNGGFDGLVVSMLPSGRPKPPDFSGENILNMPSLGGEVKPPVPCRRFAAVSVKCGEFLEKLRKRQLLKKGGALWS